MKELQNIFNEKIQQYIESGKIEEKIEAGIEKAFSSVIEDAFRWGDINKSIKAAVEEKMVISLSNIEIPSYNAVMLEALKGQITKFTNEKALSGFSDTLTELFGEAPKEITLTELVEEIIKEWKDDDPCACDGQKFAQIELKENDYGGHSLDMTDGEKYSNNKISLYISEDKIRLSHKMEINPTCLRGVNAYIFRLYSAGTKITEIEEFDIDHINTALFFEHD